jgi:hypothetical protein
VRAHPSADATLFVKEGSACKVQTTVSQCMVAGHYRLYNIPVRSWCILKKSLLYDD